MAETDIEGTGWRKTKNEAIKIKANDKGFFRSEETKKDVNSTGFAALPGGVRMIKGSFTGKGGYADFWSSTEAGSEKAYNRSLVWLLIHPGKSKIFRSKINKKWGFSVRLIKD